MEEHQIKLTSPAHSVVRASVAALVALYTGGGTKTFEAMEPMLTMRPPFGIRPTPTTACVMKITPKTLTANSYSSCSSLTSKRGVLRAAAALLTRTNGQ